MCEDLLSDYDIDNCRAALRVNMLQLMMKSTAKNAASQLMNMPIDNRVIANPGP